MSLFDEPITKVVSKKTMPPEWALCKYCRVPFLTSTFDKVCERCATNVQYQIEFKAKVMLVVIIFVAVIVVVNCLVSSYLTKYTKNFYELLLIQFILATFPGWIVWKYVKKIE